MGVDNKRPNSKCGPNRSRVGRTSEQRVGIGVNGLFRWLLIDKEKKRKKKSPTSTMMGSPPGPS